MLFDKYLSSHLNVKRPDLHGWRPRRRMPYAEPQGWEYTLQHKEFYITEHAFDSAYPVRIGAVGSSSKMYLATNQSSQHPRLWPRFLRHFSCFISRHRSLATSHCLSAAS